MSPRFAELFAGAGGLSMGLERAGFDCAWHAEIADAPRAILAHRWPDVPLYGDVTTLNGVELTAKHGAIDLLTGGSPCQDLSVAGKRAGLDGARSSLFFQQMRPWDETGADLCLWENVDGARSSNDGKDFGEVLRAFVGAAIPVPSDGWRAAGVAAGPTGVAAWRVLDAQFFGVPQRRRRVFVLGTRAGSVDPAEVLSLAESVRGDSQASREAWEGSAVSVGGGAKESRCVMIKGAAIGRAPENGPQYGDISEDGTSFTLLTNEVHAVLAFGAQNSARQGDSVSESVTPSLDKSKVPAVLAFNAKQDGSDADSIAPSLLAMPHDESHPNGGGQLAVLAFDINQIANELHRTDYHVGRESPTLSQYNRIGAVVGTLDARQTGGGFPGSDGAMSGHVQAPDGIPRRLTPRECERLMGWPDDHTLVPDAKGKLLSDAARYKACGNGVASPVTHWIGWRLLSSLPAHCEKQA